MILILQHIWVVWGLQEPQMIYKIDFATCITIATSLQKILMPKLCVLSSPNLFLEKQKLCEGFDILFLYIIL